MGKVEVVEPKRKKKGRPSLLDLQKRNIKQQQQLLQNQNQPKPSPNYQITPPTRRSTRRNHDPDLISPSDADSGDEDGDRSKLVVRLDSYDSDSNVEGTHHKKRRINAIADGSAEKEEKAVPGTLALQAGSQVDGGPSSTPLPDKTLLMFILDRLQKKDTYGVFSEPVDSKELPDYHEIIEHPMDFATVKQKLAAGAYTFLEQFEGDIFLICSNAMQYNSSDTIYFRQARSIEELAKKNFENLRQDSDNNEPTLKIVRRGRPPTKHLKNPPGRPSLERAGSEFSDATLATVGETTNRSSYDLRKGSLLLNKSYPPDSSGRSVLGTRSGEVYTGFSIDHKYERNEEYSGSILKGMKHGKKQLVPEESRRNTYMQCQQSFGLREPSVLATFDGEKKMLLAVGLHSEHGYGRSLGRFAANMGPIAWKIASNKIERSLPAGIKFGPGWVGENDIALQKQMLNNTIPSGQISQSESIRRKLLENSEVGTSEKYVPSTLTSIDGHLSKFVHNNISETSVKSAGNIKGLPSNTTNSNVGFMGPRPTLQIHQGPMNYPGMNGLNGAYQIGKATNFNFQAPRMHATISKTETSPVTSNSLNTENSSKVNSGVSNAATGQQQPFWEGLSAQQKPDLVPPDLNVRFQSPGSPSSSRVDSMQPDLALQL